MVNLKYSPITQSYFLLFGAAVEQASVIARYATRLEAIADLEAKGLMLDSRDGVVKREPEEVYILDELEEFKLFFKNKLKTP